VRFRTRLRRAVRRKVRSKVTGPAKRAIRCKTILPAKRLVRREIRKRPLFTCGACGKKYSSPFGHTCGNAGDFGKRKRARQRAERAEAAKQKRAEARKRAGERVEAARRRERQRGNERVRRERQKAAERARRAKAARKPPRRPGRPAHDYTRCRDHDCQRPACESYREGVEDGMDAAERAQ
jgi:hypothetical protein